MIEYEAVLAAMAAGENVVSAVRAASGYTIEQLSIISGLAASEVEEMQDGTADPTKLERLLTALGLSITS